MKVLYVQGSVRLFTAQCVYFLGALLLLQLRQNSQTGAVSGTEGLESLVDRIPGAGLDECANAPWPLERNYSLRSGKAGPQTLQFAEPRLRVASAVHHTHERHFRSGSSCIHQQPPFEQLKHHDKNFGGIDHR